MKIGIIGPRESCEITQQNLCYIDPSLEIRCYIREQISDSAEVVDECQQACDAVLFTGRAVELSVKQNHQVYKPHTCISRSSISIAGAFLEMQKQGMALDAFSVDIIEAQVIEDILDGFHILARNIYAYPNQDDIEERNYLQWHKSLQDEGKTNVALTSLRWVYQELKEAGCRAIYLGPTRAMIRLALERLRSGMAIDRAENAQIATELLRLEHVDKLEENYYSGMLQKTEIDRMVIRYTQEIQAAFFPAGRWEYLIFAHAGAIRSKRNQSRLLNLQKSIQDEGVRLSAGIGIGRTANAAESNARKALTYARSREHPGEIYWIDENDVINGPINRENQLRYQLISSDPRIREIAEKTGLSPASILKIRAVMDTRGSNVFDAHELADCLELTSRSARRIMKKIIDAGYADVCAKDSSTVRGRPRMLISIRDCFTTPPDHHS